MLLELSLKRWPLSSVLHAAREWAAEKSVQSEGMAGVTV